MCSYQNRGIFGCSRSRRSAAFRACRAATCADSCAKFGYNVSNSRSSPRVRTCTDACLAKWTPTLEEAEPASSLVESFFHGAPAAKGDAGSFPTYGVGLFAFAAVGYAFGLYKNTEQF